MTDRPRVLGVVCHGNILRSQVLAAALRRRLEVAKLPIDVRSAGATMNPAADYPRRHELLDEVRQALQVRGYMDLVRQTPWSAEVAAELFDCDLVLVADHAVERLVRARLGPGAPPIELFYDAAGEGAREFADTYDGVTHRQDPERFSASIPELERIAGRIVARWTRDEAT